MGWREEKREGGRRKGEGREEAKEGGGREEDKEGEGGKRIGVWYMENRSEGVENIEGWREEGGRQVQCKGGSERAILEEGVREVEN